MLRERQEMVPFSGSMPTPLHQTDLCFWCYSMRVAQSFQFTHTHTQSNLVPNACPQYLVIGSAGPASALYFFQNPFLSLFSLKSLKSPSLSSRR